MKSVNKGVWGRGTPPELEVKNKEVSVSPRTSVNIRSPLKDTIKDTFKRVTAFGSKVSSLPTKEDKVKSARLITSVKTTEEMLEGKRVYLYWKEKERRMAHNRI